MVCLHNCWIKSAKIYVVILYELPDLKSANIYNADFPAVWYTC